MKKKERKEESMPTEYRCKRCKSKLHARWAVLLDYHFMINQWDYEPHTFHHEDGREYTPDFVFDSGGAWMGFLEVLPKEPSNEYMDYLKSFLPYMAKDLWLAVGYFGGDGPTIRNLSNEDEGPFKATETPFLPKADSALDAANEFRFDLPHPVPSFRSGSVRDFKGFMAKSTSQQRNAINQQADAKQKKGGDDK